DQTRYPVAGESVRPLANTLERRAVPYRGEKHDALAGGMSTEKLDDVVIEECQPRGSQVGCVAAQVEFAADDACLDLRQPIPAVTGGGEHAFEVGEYVNVDGGVRGKLLSQVEIAGLR